VLHTTQETITFIGQKGIPKEFPGTSGIETYVEQKAIELTQNKNAVICYVRSWATTRTEYKGIKNIILPSVNTKHLDTITYSLLSSIHASLSKASIVWYHGIGPAFFLFIPKLFGKKVYTTIHSLDWKRKKWNVPSQIFLRLCEKIAITLSDNIFVVSSHLKAYYKNTYGVDPILHRYTITKSTPVKANTIQQKYGLKSNTYILFMGRFVPEKRVEWLINAYQKIAPKNIKLVLAGGSSHTDQYVKILKNMANNQIIFPGYVFGREKEELLSNCKLFVLPSLIEGYPIALVEALRYGKKCLVGDFLKSEFPQSNKEIAYFKYNDFDKFTKSLHRLITHSQSSH